MEENKKKAYLTINYQAFLDIKNSGEFSKENFNQVFRIAHVFHNLALFIIEDFEGFDEDEFWSKVRGLERDFGLTHYKILFEKAYRDELIR
ncbi:hypothetical protein QJ48_16140 [Paenibacillus sp. A3]|uniref:hypothetical protein n=1 Tax=Paenibacillus sp. A3 TaxID=1337054 RepID=UPI0006D57CBB|nr:hypothetical protein [Paenibacillus sp. A3]KPV58510.1 hypothetical protein QJ48_16140 [Paenibacillus sp. A3]